MNLLRLVKKPSRPVKRAARPPRARLFLEALEARITPDVTLSKGHLVVNGYSSNVISVFNSHLTVQEDTLNFFDYPVASVSSIEVNPGAQSGDVELQSIPASIPVTVNCTGSHDVVKLNWGQLNLATDLVGTFIVNGNGQTHVIMEDNLHFRPSVQTYTITTSSASRDGLADLSYSGLAELELIPQGGSRVNFNSTAHGTYYFLNDIGGGCHTTLGTGNLDAIQEPVSAFSNTETVDLRDSANPVGATYDIDGSSILWNGSPVFSCGQRIMNGYIEAGAGDDTINVTPWVRTGKTSGLPQNFLQIVGGGGHNVLNVDDQNAVGFAGYNLTAGSIDAHADSSGINIAYGAVQAVVVNGANHGSGISVGSVANGTSVTLNTGDGHNNVAVGGASSAGLGDIRGDLHVVGAPLGSTAVSLDDELNAAGRTAVLINSRVLVGQGEVDYSGIQSLDLDGGNGGNIFVFRDTPAGVLTTVNAGTHADTVQAGGAFFGTLDAIQGPLVINGHGNTNFTVSDLFTTTPQTYTLTGTATGESVARSGGFSATCTDLKTLSVTGGSGGNQFVVNGGAPKSTAVTLTGGGSSATSVAIKGSHCQVQSIASGSSVTLNTGAGVADVLVGNSSHGVGDIQGKVAVVGAPLGSTTVTLDDRPNSAGGTFVLFNNRVLLGQGEVDVSGIQSLVLDGGNGGNIFVFRDTPAGLLTTVNAGTHGDTVQAGGAYFGDLDSILGPLVINGRGNTTFTVSDLFAGTPQTYILTGESIVRSGGFSAICTNLQSLSVTGGSGSNQFVVTAAPPVPVTLTGGNGGDTLTGLNGGSQATTWQITGAGSGLIGKTVLFSAMHDLVGAAGKDVFVLPAGGSIAGTITGGGGGDELEYASQAGPVSINLQTHAAPQINGGTPGGFSGIPVFIGSASAADTLIGPDADDIWRISGGTAGSGTTSAERFSFSGFENLVGGSGVDVFTFLAGGSVTGSIDGGGAPSQQGNWLDYSGLAVRVAVNLQTGSATAVARGASGAVVNIQNVHGGNAGNTLTGNAAGNILIGGTGADTLIGGPGPSLLIGDKGADQIRGGAGGNLLIGDATAFDAMTIANENALMGILAEWQSADSYDVRFADINTGGGGGLNAPFKLNFGTSVTSDGAADRVTAAPLAQALDWFFKGAGDTLVNVEPGAHVNNNTPAAFNDRSVTSAIDEGSLATLSGTITVPDPHDSFTLKVNWGDGTPTQTYRFPAGSSGRRVSVTHRYRDDGTYAIQLFWTDPTGPGNQATLAVTVNNVPPTVDAGRDAEVKQGTLVIRWGSFADPGADTWKATVDYGDGTGPQRLALQGHNFLLLHYYRAKGTYQVIVTVWDDEGATGTASFTITVV
jgi:hypothetical protein